MRSIPQQLKSIPSEDLAPGSETPWLYWKCLNRISLMSNILKGKYSDADTIFNCGEQTHTMDYLLKWPMLPQEYTTEDLMEYNEAAKECVL